MDLQTLIISLLLFLLSLAVLLVISSVSMRQKSYEEAVAEQRKLTGSLWPQHKVPAKHKDKKQKNKGKKVKEKEEETETDAKEQKLHVEFEEPAVIETTANKKRVKRDRIRPILLHKERPASSEEPVINPPVTVNHFEQIHPKDDIELLHAHKKTEEPKQKPEEPKKSKSKKSEPKAEPKPEVTEPVKQEPAKPEPTKQTTKSGKNKNQVQATGDKEREVPEPEIVKQEVKTSAAPALHNSAKDKKKKKSEFNTLQQMTSSDKGGVNVSLLVPLVRKADLTRSEIQILIDLLLNKQHEAPNLADEWSEGGRQDPVQKLKKQLSEKEKALLSEQEATTGLQAKLREVRAELNSERARLMQNCRSLEENCNVKQTELHASAARNHALQQKLQQMQAQLNEEMMTARKLREENNAIQMQRKKIEIHLASINEQQQEADASFQAQVTQARLELQEQQSLNGQLSLELRQARETAHQEKEMLQETLRHMEAQMAKWKLEIEVGQDAVRQLEECHHKIKELEQQHSMNLTRESDLKLLSQQHLEEARRLQSLESQSIEDKEKLQAELNRLNNDKKSLLDEHDALVSKLRNEISNLQKQNEKLEAANGEAAVNKVKEVEVLNLQNEISSLKAQLQHKDTQFENTHKNMKQMEHDLQEQKNKNDELRKKNWKAMEALNTAESALHKKTDNNVNINEIKQKTMQEAEENNRKLLERLFPEIKLPSSCEWQGVAERSIKAHLATLQQPRIPPTAPASNGSDKEVAKLQAQLQHYKSVVEETDGVLTSLQLHIAQEERQWRFSLAEKEAEIASLRDKLKPELDDVIKELEGRVTEEQALRQQLEQQCESLRVRQDPTEHKHTQSSQLVNHEKLTQENCRLVEELTKEKQRSCDLNEQVLRLQSQISDSIHSKAPQNHTNGTALEIDSELSNSASSSVSNSSNNNNHQPQHNNKRNKKKKNAGHN